MNDIRQINQKIIFYLELFNQKSYKIIDGYKNIIAYYSKKKIIEEKEKLDDFKSYLYKKTGIERKDLAIELYKKIINSIDSVEIIGNDQLIDERPVNYFISLFSNYSYLSNIINVITDKYLDYIKKTLSLLKDSFKDFVNLTIKLIDLHTHSIFTNPNNQLLTCKELYNFYNEKIRQYLIKLKKI